MKKIFLLAMPVLIMAISCSHKATQTTGDSTTAVAVGYGSNEKKGDAEQSQMVPQTKLMNPEGIVLKATAFKMSGDYSNNVAITLDNAGNIIYYPAPTDITVNSKPESLGDGWWLNRQGLSFGSVFTRYTFSEYAALKTVPTREELKAAIIPGARVIEMVQLPYSVYDAEKNLPQIKDYLKKLN